MVFSDVSFGIIFNPRSFRCEWASVVEAAVMVEKYGFDSFWALRDPGITILAVAANNTKKLRIGTVISPLYDYPAPLARDLATLDNISGGRLIVGLGTMTLERTQERWGVPVDRPVTRMLETIEIMKKLWTENDVTYNGKFYNVQKLSLHLKPVQKPHPPIWIDSGGPRMLRITATHGNGWIGAWKRGHVPKVYQEILAEIRLMAERAGRDPKEIEPAHLSHTSISLDHDVARKRIERGARSSLVRWRVHKDLGYEEPWTRREDIPLEALEKMKGSWLFGTPDECIEKIEGFIKAGARHVILWIMATNEKGFFDAVKLCGEKVIPYFKEKL